MRAVRIVDGTPTLETLAGPEGDGVRVKVASSSICGSDLHLLDGGIAEGMILGHEFCGIAPDGTPVAVEPMAGCGSCWACDEGHLNFCSNGAIFYGIGLCVLGMIVFNLGLSYGLSMLGDQSGRMVPGAFIHLDEVKGSPLFSVALGVSISVLFAWILGFGATLAEPAPPCGVALRICVDQVQNTALGHHGIVVEILLQPFPQLQRQLVERFITIQQIV